MLTQLVNLSVTSLQDLLVPGDGSFYSVFNHEKRSITCRTWPLRTDFGHLDGDMRFELQSKELSEICISFQF